MVIKHTPPLFLLCAACLPGALGFLPSAFHSIPVVREEARRSALASFRRLEAKMAAPVENPNSGYPMADEEVKTMVGVVTPTSGVSGKESEGVTNKEPQLSPVTGMTEETEKNLLQKIKDAWSGGAISYAAWELAFWGFSLPVALFAYYEFAGHLPDFSNAEDLEKLGAEAFAFVNVARFAVPLRIGLALSTVPFFKENVVDRFGKAQGEKTKTTD